VVNSRDFLVHRILNIHHLVRYIPISLILWIFATQGCEAFFYPMIWVDCSLVMGLWLVSSIIQLWSRRLVHSLRRSFHNWSGSTCVF
jgi:hypothetical protein